MCKYLLQSNKLGYLDLQNLVVRAEFTAIY